MALIGIVLSQNLNSNRNFWRNTFVTRRATSVCFKLHLRWVKRDELHFNRCSADFTGDWYVLNQFSPVISDILNMMNGLSIRKRQFYQCICWNWPNKYQWSEYVWYRRRWCSIHSKSKRAGGIQCVILKADVGQVQNKAKAINKKLFLICLLWRSVWVINRIF